MKLEDIPNVKATQYPIRITVCVSQETKNKFDALKRRRKDTSELIRMLLDEFLDKIPTHEFDTSA